jgi:ketosteroid isomerase-like protein
MEPEPISLSIKEVARHPVENFRFFDLKVYALADPQGAVAEVKGEGLIKSTGRMYRQDYVVFLRAAHGKIAFLREYFDPVHAAPTARPRSSRIPPRRCARSADLSAGASRVWE